MPNFASILASLSGEPQDPGFDTQLNPTPPGPQVTPTTAPGPGAETTTTAPTSGNYSPPTGTTLPPGAGSPLDFLPSDGGPDPYNTRMDALRAAAGPEHSFDDQQQVAGGFSTPGDVGQGAGNPPPPPPAGAATQPPPPPDRPPNADQVGGDYFKSLIEEMHQAPDLNSVKESLIGPLRAAYEDQPMSAAEKVGLFALALSNPQGAMDMIKLKQQQRFINKQKAADLEIKGIGIAERVMAADTTKKLAVATALKDWAAERHQATMDASTLALNTAKTNKLVSDAAHPGGDVKTAYQGQRAAALDSLAQEGNASPSEAQIENRRGMIAANQKAAGQPLSQAAQKIQNDVERAKGSIGDIREFTTSKDPQDQAALNRFGPVSGKVLRAQYTTGGGAYLNERERKLAEAVGFFESTGYQAFLANSRSPEVIADIKRHIPKFEDTPDQIKSKIDYLDKKYGQLLNTSTRVAASRALPYPDLDRGATATPGAGGGATYSSPQALLDAAKAGKVSRADYDRIRTQNGW